MIQKKLITWREADRAMVALAFQVLAMASRSLRDTDQDPAGFHPVDGPTLSIENGFVSSNENEGWWSYPARLVHSIGNGEIDFLHVDKLRGFPSAVCWYSFQNLVRQNLKKARKEIKAARYMRSNEAKTSKQSSRNAVKRKTGNSSS